MSVIDVSALKSGLSALPPLSLYIHFPWCIRKCPYCDFNSHEAKQGFDEIAYVDSLLQDLEYSLPEIWGRAISSIFMGGGTPSLFSAIAIDRLLSGIRARLRWLPEIEITLEANPGTFEADKFQGYRDAGVNRLSIGVQSFHSPHLQVLGRIHQGDEAKRAVEQAQAYFDNINLDLMYALPGQSLAQAQQDMALALALGPTHISAYHLTIEPNTLYAAKPPAHLPEDELSADMQEALEQALAQAGFSHYETSAFAQPGRQARHNVNYWQFGDYLGIGAGAHSKISRHDGISRHMRYKQPAAYLQAVAQGQPVQQSQDIANKDLAFEFMMNALRLTGGFEKRLFRERTGLTWQGLEKPLQQAEQQGLLQQDLQRVWPTAKGQRFLNDLLTLFLVEGES